MTKTLNPYTYKIPVERIDPRQSVLPEILEQHPWHWDPAKQDHTDSEDAYQRHVDNFDWEGLAQWSINKVNQYSVPDKFWWYDYENDRVMHSNDDVTDMPICEQAKLALKNNSHNEHNSQYFKIANEEFEHWEQPLRDLFPEFNKDKLGISLFIQPPGHTIWSHADTFSSFIRRTNDAAPDYSRLRRYMVFVRDWDFGHFFHQGNSCLNQWKAGDLWNITPGVYHGSANAGINPKITIHWSGEVD